MTLVELILALGVVVLAAAIVVPTVLSLADSNRLMQTADDFKGLLAGLRSRVLEESVAVEIVIEQNASGYKVVRADSSATPPASAASAAPPAWHDVDSSARVEFDRDAAFGEHKLPEGVIFRNLRAPTTSDAAPPGTIRFYPNGTATPIEFEIFDPVAGAVRFHIRGLTGNVSSKRVYSGRGGSASEAAP
jgi:type II secretory pathway pseudopilin PulG